MNFLSDDEKKIPFEMLLLQGYDINDEKLSLGIHPNSTTA